MYVVGRRLSQDPWRKGTNRPPHKRDAQRKQAKRGEHLSVGSREPPSPASCPCHGGWVVPPGLSDSATSQRPLQKSPRDSGLSRPWEGTLEDWRLSYGVSRCVYVWEEHPRLSPAMALSRFRYVTPLQGCPDSPECPCVSSSSLFSSVDQSLFSPECSQAEWAFGSVFLPGPRPIDIEHSEQL